jgi:ABC-2 type transport system ATP-binding protein
MEHMLVDVNNLSRSFGRKLALDRVNFHVAKGRVCGLVGANGAGKTTLIKHLLGLLRAQSGFVRVFDHDPVRDPVAVLSRIGYLSEERELPEWMRVDELMAYTQAFHPTWDTSYAQQLLETFALDPSRKIKELSKGMRAQAGLVAAGSPRSISSTPRRTLADPQHGHQTFGKPGSRRRVDPSGKSSPYQRRDAGLGVDPPDTVADGI